MGKVRAAITGVQGWLPDYILTNQELETMIDTSDEWIVTRTGIKTRHILKGEELGPAYMASEAIKGLCEKTGTDVTDIDLIIIASVTADYQFPSSANIVCDLVGATKAYGFDLSAACSGFLFALVTGTQFIESGMHKKVVVVGADKMSSIVDYTDRSTCIIFGDGAGAVLLEPDESGNGVIDSILRNDGAGRHHLIQPAGGSALPASHQTVDRRQHYIKQEGQTVFKFAVKGMADVAVEIMENNALKSEEIAWLVPHQANKRIIDATASRMGLDSSKVMINIDRLGNTTAATIPLCLWEWEDQIKAGDNLILSAFGGGFTWGAVYLKWAYSR